MQMLHALTAEQSRGYGVTGGRRSRAVLDASSCAAPARQSLKRSLSACPRAVSSSSRVRATMAETAGWRRASCMPPDAMCG